MISLDLNELPQRHQLALRRGASVLIDEGFEDIALLLDGADFASTRMLDYLPRKYLPRYTPLFAKGFLTCILAVTQKMWSPEVCWLSCTAEELALNAIIEKAKDELALDEEPDEEPLESLYDCMFEDNDFLRLFDLEDDGIEDSAIGVFLGMGQLHFGDWFKPFDDRRPAHPYVEEVPRDDG